MREGTQSDVGIRWQTRELRRHVCLEGTRAFHSVIIAWMP